MYTAVRVKVRVSRGGREKALTVLVNIGVPTLLAGLSLNPVFFSFSGALRTPSYPDIVEHVEAGNGYNELSALLNEPICVADRGNNELPL